MRFTREKLSRQLNPESGKHGIVPVRKSRSDVEPTNAADCRADGGVVEKYVDSGDSAARDSPALDRQHSPDALHEGATRNRGRFDIYLYVLQRRPYLRCGRQLADHRPASAGAEDQGDPVLSRFDAPD